MTNIVKNNSQAYGYKYASLSDIAEQGVEIPKMKTGTEEGIEYVYYYDTELKEWIRGARVVVPDNKQQNKAQQYASGITYARRVTTQLAKQLACSDDQDIETDAPKPASEKQIEYMQKLYSQTDIDRILEHHSVDELEQLDANTVSEYIAMARRRNEKHNQQQ